MWHVKIVDGVLKQEPGPLKPGASSHSLAEFVSHALAAEPGWCSADASLFGVEDVSGCGGSKTYKVAATHVYSPQLRPSSVALHCRLKPIMDRSSYFPRRMAAATRVFSASGLGPRRLLAPGSRGPGSCFNTPSTILTCHMIYSRRLDQSPDPPTGSDCCRLPS